MEIRRLKAQEFRQAVELADRTFRDEGHVSMGDAFPHVFSEELELSIGAFDGERLVSFMGLVPSTITVGPARLNVFSIGAVCTDESYQKRGIASLILKEVYRFIDEAQGSLLLISGDRGLYTRNHCYHFGQVAKYILEGSVRVDGDYDCEVRPGKKEDVFQVQGLRVKEQVQLECSAAEWMLLLKSGGYTSIFKMEQALFVAEKDGVLEGYVVVGLPTDKSTYRQGIVTDWGGDRKSVVQILLTLIRDGVVPKLEVKVPWQDDLNQELKGISSSANVEKNGGTMHVVDASRLLEQAMPYLRERGLKGKVEIKETADKGYALHMDGKEHVLSHEELVELLFGFDHELHSQFEGIFPIPLPSTEGIWYV